jgi:VWFA-related protein
MSHPSRISALLLALCLAPFARSQSPNPQKPLTHRDSESFNQLQRAQRHITLNLNVTDKTGKQVPSLTQQDFTLLDNGKPQTIADFKSVDGAFAQPPDVVLLVVDTLNSALTDLTLVRQGIEKYIRQSGSYLFTRVSIVLLGNVGANIGEPSRDTKTLLAEVAKLPATVRSIDAAQGTAGAIERSQKSIRGLTEIAKYEADKPGHKLLIWLGPGWPLLYNLETPTQLNRTRYFTSIVDLNTRLRKANITLYSVIPQNLQRGDVLRQFVYQDYLNGVQTAKDADSPNLGVQVLATQSGGRVMIDNGDVATEIAHCIEDSRAYYQLSFDAEPAAIPNEFHDLQIKPARPNLTPRTTHFVYLQPDAPAPPQ